MVLAASCGPVCGAAPLNRGRAPLDTPMSSPRSGVTGNPGDGLGLLWSLWKTLWKTLEGGLGCPVENPVENLSGGQCDGLSQPHPQSCNGCSMVMKRGGGPASHPTPAPAMTTTLHPLFAKANEIRANIKSIIDNPRYELWDSPDLHARVIELETELNNLHESEEYIEAMAPFYNALSAGACYGGV